MSTNVCKSASSVLFPGFLCLRGQTQPPRNQVFNQVTDGSGSHHHYYIPPPSPHRTRLKVSGWASHPQVLRWWVPGTIEPGNEATVAHSYGMNIHHCTVKQWHVHNTHPIMCHQSFGLICSVTLCWLSRHSLILFSAMDSLSSKIDMVCRRETESDDANDM